MLVRCHGCSIERKRCNCCERLSSQWSSQSVIGGVKVDKRKEIGRRSEDAAEMGREVEIARLPEVYAAPALVDSGGGNEERWDG
jgi:hypothetical protein